MAAWPGTLPSVPLFDSFRYEPIPQSISSVMETGPPKRRRRFSVAYGFYHMEFSLTEAQRGTFETFYGTTMAGGSSTITGFNDPRDDTAATFQFADGGDPRWVPEKPEATVASRRWRLSVTWERTA